MQKCCKETTDHQVPQPVVVSKIDDQVYFQKKSECCGGKRPSPSEAVKKSVGSVEQEVAKEAVRWAERVNKMADDFDARLQAVRDDYETVIEDGFSEAYDIILDLRKKLEEATARITALEAHSEHVAAVTTPLQTYGTGCCSVKVQPGECTI